MRPSCSRGHASFPRCLLALSAVFWLTAAPASAEPIEGTYVIPFDGAESIWPLFDLHDCETDVIDGNNVEVCMDISLARSAAGRVDGSGTFDFQVRGIGIKIDGTLAGTLRGGIAGSDQRGYRQTLGLRFSGTVAVEGVGESLPASMSGRITTSITPAGLRETRGVLKVKVKRGTTSKIPVGHSPAARKYAISGTAEAVLPDGTRFLPIVGSYTPKADTATLVAKGRGANKGIWIQLKSIRSASPGTLERGAVTYGIQGFTGKQSLVPAPPRD